jgi:hypothetical protein
MNPHSASAILAFTIGISQIFVFLKAGFSGRDILNDWLKRAINAIEKSAIK